MDAGEIECPSEENTRLSGNVIFLFKHNVIHENDEFLKVG